MNGMRKWLGILMRRWPSQQFAADCRRAGQDLRPHDGTFDGN